MENSSAVVTESDHLVMNGTVRAIEGSDKFSPLHTNTEQTSQSQISLKKDDFYRDLLLRGYNYSNDFQVIEMAQADGYYGEIAWAGNWVTFLDGLFQLDLFGNDTYKLAFLSRIRRLRIYPQYQHTVGSKATIEVFKSPNDKRIISGGVEIIELTTKEIQRKKSEIVEKIGTHKFIPYFSTEVMDIENITRCCMQIVYENFLLPELNIIDFTSDKFGSEFLKGLLQELDELPMAANTLYQHHESKNSAVENIDRVIHTFKNDQSQDVIKAGLIVSTLDALQDNLNSLEEKGFLLLRTTPSQDLESMLKDENLSPIASFTSFNETVKVVKKLSRSKANRARTYIKISKTKNWIEDLEEKRKSTEDVILVSENADNNDTLAIVNFLRKKPKWSAVRCVLIEDVEAPALTRENHFYEQQLSLDLATNILRKGIWGSYHCLKPEQEHNLATHCEHIYASLSEIGNCSSIKWIQGSGFKDNYILTTFSSLNMRDIMLAFGRLPIEILKSQLVNQLSMFGMEFSGLDPVDQNRVMGITICGAMSSHISKNKSILWEVPKQWSLRDAATIPLAYVTVYYAFFEVVDVRRGKSILLHVGNSSIGIAAIRVALAYGLNVFTTVSSLEQKKILLNLFPSLEESHVGSNNDTSFEDMVLESTNSAGVDFVLNCLSGDKLAASLRCLAIKGHLLDIGKIDVVNNNSLGLGVFLNELSFHVVDLNNLFEEDSNLVKSLKEHITEDIEKGVIQPLPSTVFASTAIQQAFRYVFKEEYYGKVLIQIRPDMEKATTPPPLLAFPKTYFDPSLAYIVSEGLSSFGLEFMNWIIIRGARKMVISSASGTLNSYQDFRVSKWKKFGCDIFIKTSNLETVEECKDLINIARKKGPIGGVFCLVNSLESSLFESELGDVFLKYLHSKSALVKHFDKLTRHLCPELKHFTVLSNLSCVDCGIKITSCVFGTLTLEQIIENRVSNGLPGQFIQLGVSQNCFSNYDVSIINKSAYPYIWCCVDALDSLFASSDCLVCCKTKPKRAANTSAKSAIDFVMNTLKISDFSSVDPNTIFLNMGMDSLTAIEITEVLKRDFDIIFNDGTLRNTTLSKFLEVSEGHKKSVSKNALKNIQYEDVLDLLFGHLSFDNFSENIFDVVNEVKEGDPIIILPGFGGCSGNIWKILSNNFNMPAYVMQLRDTCGESLDSVVHYAFKEIMTFLEKKKLKKFQVIAYSFGTIIAHPTIELLEKNGFNGSAVYISGSPIMTKKLVETILSAFTVDEFQRRALSAVINSLVPIMETEQIERDLSEKLYWESKMQYICKLLHQHQKSEFIVENIISYSNFLMKQIQMLKSVPFFKLSSIIESKLMLIRPTKSKILNTEETYGLTPLTRNIVNTKMIEGDHKTLLQNTNLPLIINNFFSK